MKDTKKILDPKHAELTYTILAIQIITDAIFQAK